MTEIALAADFAIIVVVATVVGIIARQLNQPTIIAYIATGVILGPVVFGVVSHDDPLVEVMAELGLGFLLFLLGMKMRFSDIQDILRPITNVAIGQTVLQTALAFLVAWWLGFEQTEVLVIALATVFGATPVIVKVLTDKDEITSLPGKIDVGVLIVQDIYLVIILALFAADTLDGGAEIASTLGVIFVMMAFIAIFSIASSRYILPRLFRQIANNKDVFLIVAIAWAFLFIAIAEGFDLSVEVGAFLAGISLAQLPYSKELEDRVTPITDFFILIFFASIGLQIEGVSSLFAYWQEALIASAVLMVGNFWIMFYLIDREGFDVETSFLGSINMVQVSEFSLVVGGLALAQGHIDADVLGYLTLMALLTMSISTYIITYNRRIFSIVEPWFDRFTSDAAVDAGVDAYEDHVVAIGFDEVTQYALPVLESEYDEVVVVDRRNEAVEAIEAAERYDFVFGDVRHTEVRKAVNLSAARFVLSSTVEPDVNRAILDELDEETVAFVEAEYIDDARDLYERGADYVIMSTYLAAEQLSYYLETYVDDRDAFEEAIEGDLRRIERGGSPDAAEDREPFIEDGGADDG
ncbi:cation:proton antiporter [Halovivax gelatinilyticus]|uniref:cation:proton antiporter n=1 Tax=Halovivax gelatinilyticus TaxID=2961597 RepID=UPI0020CA5E86|nr:cation:proton antiporter [Halovivax gelatinilyticus]